MCAESGIEGIPVIIRFKTSIPLWTTSIPDVVLKVF